jgi:hypothetical protein
VIPTVALAISVMAGGAGESTPKPLTGVPLRGATHLQLLVASNPPYLLNVDRGRRTRVSGLALGRGSVVAVSAVGRDAFIYVDEHRPRSLRGARIYALRRGDTRARRLATGWEVASTADGVAVWLKSYLDKTHCALRKLGLDGRETQKPRAVSCSSHLVDSGSGAVLVDGDSIADVRTGETLITAHLLSAIAGDFAITADGDQAPISVTNLRTGERWRLRYPSRIGGQGGIGYGGVDRDQRLVAIEFGDPAYQFTGTQVTDVWMLNLEQRAVEHLPDMPAAVALKFTSMQWTTDGRLVFLAETNDRTVLAVWRPGQKRIRVRPLHIPARNSGSDSFVAWVTG